MLCIDPCESLTQNFVAPPLAAPSMQAFASSAIHLRARSYSTPCIITWLYAATPPMPSMSTEIHTLFAVRFGTAAMVRGLTRLRRCALDHLHAIKWVRPAEVAKLVNALPSGGSARKGLGVQIPPSAQSAESMARRVVVPDPPLPVELRYVITRVHEAKQRDRLAIAKFQAEEVVAFRASLQHFDTAAYPIRRCDARLDPFEGHAARGGEERP